MFLGISPKTLSLADTEFLGPAGSVSLLRCLLPVPWQPLAASPRPEAITAK